MVCGQNMTSLLQQKRLVQLWQPTGFLEKWMLSHVTVLKRWQKGNKGTKMLGNGFWTKYDVNVAIATYSATMTTLWVCGEFDAQSCDSVKTVTEMEIES